jgi:quercetin dioxygenase-like cupin family protein
VKMRRLDINNHIEFRDGKFNPVVLIDAPDVRLLLLCLRAGQQVPEHAAAGGITVQTITGYVAFYDGDEVYEMSAGSLLRLDAGRAHRVEAHTDAALLVTMLKTSRTFERREGTRAGDEEPADSVGAAPPSAAG